MVTSDWYEGHSIIGIQKTGCLCTLIGRRLENNTYRFSMLTSTQAYTVLYNLNINRSYLLDTARRNNYCYE